MSKKDAPLPEPYCNAHEDAGSFWPDMFSGYQMRAYAAEQVAAERERCALVCDTAASEYERAGVVSAANAAAAFRGLARRIRGA